MSDVLIMAACAVAGYIMIVFVRGLLDGLSSGLVSALPIG